MSPARVAWMVFGCMLGAAAGAGAYTFHYAHGTAYLQNDPEACANCHIMREQLDGWTKGGHRAVAGCNDCHTPPGLVGKLATKASNGFWHSYAFTSGEYPEHIRIKPYNRQVTEQACRKCHQEIVHAIDSPLGLVGPLECTRCHSRVGHR